MMLFRVGHHGSEMRERIYASEITVPENLQKFFCGSK